MKTLSRSTAHRPSSTSPAVAAQVVVAGGVVVAACATLAAVLGAGLVLTTVLTLAAVLVTTVCARHTLSSLFAGLTLQLARPYAPGEHVRLFVPEAGQVAQAEVVKLGVISTTLATSDGMLVVPNTHMLRATPDQRAAA